MTIIPEGWVLAPREPDLNQLAAAINAETTDYAPEPNLVVCDFIDPSNHVAAMGAYERNKADSGGEWTRAFLTTIYRAMLASAPPAPGGFSLDVASDGLHRVAQERQPDDNVFSAAGLRVWRDGGWTILHADTGGVKTTISLSPEQALMFSTWLVLEPNDLEPTPEELEDARKRTLRKLAQVRKRNTAADHLDSALYDEKKRMGFDAPDDAEYCVSLTVEDWRVIEALLSESPEEGLGPDGGETAKRRDEPLTPSPSLADKGLVEAKITNARSYANALRDGGWGPMPEVSAVYKDCALIIDGLADALEARLT